MQVTCQLTPEDFYQECLAWRNRRKCQRLLRWIAFFIVAIASLTCLDVRFFARNSEADPIAWFGITFGVGWWAYMLLAPRFYSRRQFRNNPMAQSPITLDASEQGFEFHSPHAESKVAWSAYISWGEAKSVFIVMPQPHMYIAIPKRAFAEDEIGEFREILRRNIGKK